MKMLSVSRMVTAGLAFVMIATSPVPALAQDQNPEARMRKIEAEIRALQRKVFPGGDARFFEPEINTAQPQSPSTANTTSTTAVTDILARLDAIEAQLQRLTAAGEENLNAVSLLEERVVALETAQAELKSQITAPAPSEPAAQEEPAATESNLAAMTGGAAAPQNELPPVAAPVGPSEERLEGVQAIAKPQSGDPGDDEYIYGFRLWEAGFFPEAQQQLSLFVEQYPEHWRTTYGRNLLGRAYLDDGKPREAAPWFLRNYQVDKQAARAGDSLLYLAEAMIALEDNNRACIALAEFGETYPALAAGRLKDQYEANRQKVPCN